MCAYCWRRIFAHWPLCAVQTTAFHEPRVRLLAELLIDKALVYFSLHALIQRELRLNYGICWPPFRHASLENRSFFATPDARREDAFACAPGFLMAAAMRAGCHAQSPSSIFIDTPWMRFFSREASSIEISRRHRHFFDFRARSKLSLDGVSLHSPPPLPPPRSFQNGSTPLLPRRGAWRMI